jgi:two-component system KDP operon response regulator KdpE
MPVPRLLAIDDDELMVQLMTTIAHNAGFEVASASGEDALDVYERFQPDVILLDILMPTLDGFEIISYLTARNSRARIILTSGDQNYLRMAESMAGDRIMVDAVFRKPFDVDMLHTRLCELSHAFPGIATGTA